MGCLLVAFWGVVAAGSLGIRVGLLQEVLGTVLLTLVPGFLILLLVEHDIDSGGEILLYTVGFSLVSLATTGVLVSLLYPVFGVIAPLSFLPLALTISAISVVLSLSAFQRDRSLTLRVPPFDTRDITVGAFLLSLPLLAVLAASRMNAVGDSGLMYVFLLLVAGVVVVSIRVVPPKLYPLAVFAVAAAVVLHNNLITNAVVGSDIQINHFFVELLLENGVWEAGMGDVYSSIPVVGTVPAVYAAVTGISPAFVFKVLYSLLFALVPVGIYYAFKDVFGSDVAFVGAYFFVFYFRTFNGTPGKTRMAQLFVVLLLLVLLTDRERLPGKEWIGFVFGVGLIFSHYTTTYIVVISLAVAYVLGRIYVAYANESLDWNIVGVYAVAFGGTAVGWYAVTTPGMIASVVEVLGGIPVEIYAALSGEAVHRSGASAIQEGSGTVYLITLLLHMGLMALAGIGVLSQVLVALFPTDRNQRLEAVKLATIAIPMFVFLGASYFVTGDLGADRMYQIVLVVLAPFMPVGAIALAGIVSAIRDVEVPVWRPILAALAVLLLLNTGVVYNAVGAPVTSDIALDDDTHSLAYTDAEIDGGEWIDDTSIAAPVIYTDSYTGEMFRGIVPESYTDASVVQIKVDWRPGIEFSEGYVYVRDRAVVDAAAYDGDPPEYYLTEPERAAIERSTNKVYTSGEADVFRYDGSDSQQFGRDGV
ncbi:DUF2206 domain-containing protein [Halalkalicoccus sp. NIPERK01]|uniref:DUF2206 domain-containing protein n=1 Tax=Halalkalicoccus sp. NIPERK01 TaxID=3053469 RepID=UPI00256F2426